MANYLAQLNKVRAGQREKAGIRQRATTDSAKEITIVEWMMVGFIALIADLADSLLLGPIGFIFASILLFWHVMRFNRFPTKRFIGSGLIEAASFGLLPGWLGFTVMTYLKQKKSK